MFAPIDDQNAMPVRCHALGNYRPCKSCTNYKKINQALSPFHSVFLLLCAASGALLELVLLAGDDCLDVASHAVPGAVPRVGGQHVFYL